MKENVSGCFFLNTVYNELCARKAIIPKRRYMEQLFADCRPT